MPQGLENQIVATLTTIIQSVGWIGILLIMAVESANIPIPSEITMPLAGWLLVQAAPHNGTAIEAVLGGGLIGPLGCFLCLGINYAVGACGGPPFSGAYAANFIIS